MSSAFELLIKQQGQFCASLISTKALLHDLIKLTEQEGLRWQQSMI